VVEIRLEPGQACVYNPPTAGDQVERVRRGAAAGRKEFPMKTLGVFALGLAFCFTAAAGGQDKKADKFDPDKLVGKWELTGGKKNGGDISPDAKKSEFTIAKEKITIKGTDMTFVIAYKLDPAKTPVTVDFEITEGPEGAKGSKAAGILELKGDDLKLAYNPEGGDRPAKFDGDKGFSFTFKRAKDAKK
jgi:uncharacterized protein (TIGR03067 family)